MTAIAYRDRVMAGDGLTIFTNTLDEETWKQEHSLKIVKRKGFLFGCSGIMCPSMDILVPWYLAELGESTREAIKGSKFTLMVVGPDEKIVLWDQQGLSYPLEESFLAIGAGEQYAMGAMEAGATAIQAVKIAAKHHPHCGGKVSWRKLSG